MMAVRKRMWIAAAIGAFGLGLPLTPAGEALADSSKLFLVKVMNGAGNPVPVRDVDQPARQIFRESLSCAVAQGQIDCMNQLSVPAGKLLVIETISATLNVPGGQQPSLSVVVGSTPEFGFLVPLVRTASFTSPLATDLYGGLAPVRLYVSLGEHVRLFFLRDQSTSGGSASLTLSGYMVDCGAGPGCPLP